MKWSVLSKRQSRTITWLNAELVNIEFWTVCHDLQTTVMLSSSLRSVRNIPHIWFMASFRDHLCFHAFIPLWAKKLVKKIKNIVHYWGKLRLLLPSQASWSITLLTTRQFIKWTLWEWHMCFILYIYII